MGDLIPPLCNPPCRPYARTRLRKRHEAVPSRGLRSQRLSLFSISAKNNDMPKPYYRETRFFDNKATCYYRILLNLDNKAAVIIRFCRNRIIRSLAIIRSASHTRTHPRGAMRFIKWKERHPDEPLPISPLAMSDMHVADCRMQQMHPASNQSSSFLSDLISVSLSQPTLAVSRFLVTMKES